MINKSVIFSARTDSYRALYSMGVVLINSSAIAPIREGRASLFRRRSSPSKNKTNSFICLMPGSSPPEEGERSFNENKKVEKKNQIRLEGDKTRCGKTVTRR